MSDQFDPLAIAAKLGIMYVPFLFSLCFHEYAHGWMARRKGDNTALMLGRLTMNPMAHVDMMGTVLLPILAILFSWPFFGWAKPVPVNARNFKHPKKDMFWVAAAGPLANILLAFIACFLLVLADSKILEAGASKALIQFGQTFIILNLFLAFFNLIPLHPLDGGKILARFLPPRVDMQLEANQHVTSWILVALFLFGALNYLAGPVYWTADLMLRLAEKIIT